MGYQPTQQKPRHDGPPQNMYWNDLSTREKAAFIDGDFLATTRQAADALIRVFGTLTNEEEIERIRKINDLPPSEPTRHNGGAPCVLRGYEEL